MLLTYLNFYEAKKPCAQSPLHSGDRIFPDILRASAKNEVPSG
jgi:hypothetical protein